MAPFYCSFASARGNSTLFSRLMWFIKSSMVSLMPLYSAGGTGLRRWRNVVGDVFNHLHQLANRPARLVAHFLFKHREQNLLNLS